MVRELKTGKKTLEELEAITDKQIESLDDIRKKEFKEELDTAYYFSIVFDTNTERDLWLKEHNLSLIDNFFIKAKDFKV